MAVPHGFEDCAGPQIIDMPVHALVCTTMSGDTCPHTTGAEGTADVKVIALPEYKLAPTSHLHLAACLAAQHQHISTRTGAGAGVHGDRIALQRLTMSGVSLTMYTGIKSGALNISAERVPVQQQKQTTERHHGMQADHHHRRRLLAIAQHEQNDTAADRQKQH